MNRFVALVCAGAVFTAGTQIPSLLASAAAQVSPLDASEIQYSYEKLRTDFYKNTTAQSIVNGARAELSHELHLAGINAALPPILASENSTRTAQAVDHEVDLATRAARGKVNAHDLSYAAIDGMMRSVNDKYTVFMTPKEYAALNQNLDGTSFAGTGIVIEQNPTTKYIDVESVVPGGPADKAGILQDDVILAVDGLSTKGMSLQTASTHLRGKEGTPVRLTIQRGTQVLPAPITIVRAQIQQLSVYQKMLPGKIGYAQLTVFGRNTGDELTQALNRLDQEGARAIILDLRDNGGGYLQAAIDVSSKFISTGPIVSVESHSNVTTYDAEDTAIPPLPLTVLVNDHTASASEITSAAIQDTGVGTIIGTKTYGKGVVQEILPLPDGAAIKITDARYLTPHNRDINHVGITPDIVVTENKSARFGDPSQDAQLGRAIQFLNDKIAHIQGGAGSL